MKSFFSGKLRRLPVVLMWLLTAGLLTTACKKDNETTTDYTTVDDAAIKKYLADNAITTAQKQPSGLYYIPVTTNAAAPKPTANQIVSILYTGKLLNGTVFDATSQRDNTPLSFILGVNRIIPGLEEGISLMHKGDKAVFLIPSGLAYGPSGAAPSIPANAVISFEVELTDINTSFAVPDDNLIVRYLAKNNITTAQKQTSGLYFVPTVSNPTGVPAAAGKTISVLYTGKLLNGTVFDATKANNVPFTFVVGAMPKQVIPGFDEGISLMRKGEKATLLIPSALAYGASGSGSIPANAVITFDVEVVDVK
ncbi:FKBP-type peptidyl-prolyl cis-trans isomerase [Hymenobacter sp. H14-R3]|uniref:FKBP-type peptidyl-prolyl cis-trans isomerase n=1 Tax=Hymenobacter sp. H14-R3 TaxID=3046308 RepID=UPI0024B883EB|nr:FKBP-type peptidyl-prolyl cis-trans isomerase [Hymenobacter sp. H14-R3]MDJ0365484.1 FKBP-type peptidyl-prolyl cis-trans isomerase [Hymenobacter sp. H14-R3]